LTGLTGYTGLDILKSYPGKSLKIPLQKGLLLKTRMGWELNPGRIFLIGICRIVKDFYSRNIQNGEK
jgi:hypothetical protein